MTFKVEQKAIDSSFKDWQKNVYPYAHPVQDRPAFDSGFIRGAKYQAARTTPQTKGGLGLTENELDMNWAPEFYAHIKDGKLVSSSNALSFSLLPKNEDEAVDIMWAAARKENVFRTDMRAAYRALAKNTPPLGGSKPDEPLSETDKILGNIGCMKE